MKPPWITDLETDEADERIDSILGIVLVTLATLLCATALGFVLGIVWPHLSAAFEAGKFAP